jgi:hypothetical protein
MHAARVLAQLGGAVEHGKDVTAQAKTVRLSFFAEHDQNR